MDIVIASILRGMHQQIAESLIIDYVTMPHHQGVTYNALYHNI